MKKITLSDALKEMGFQVNNGKVEMNHQLILAKYTECWGNDDNQFNPGVAGYAMLEDERTEQFILFFLKVIRKGRQEKAIALAELWQYNPSFTKLLKEVKESKEHKTNPWIQQFCKEAEKHGMLPI